MTAQDEGVGNVLMQGNKMTAVIIIILIILTGIVAFLAVMERRIKRLEDDGSR